MSGIRINPALVAAIEHYAEGRFSFHQPTCFVYTDANGHQSAWPLERACGLAAEILSYEDLAYLKLKELQDGLRKHGLHDLYRHIMKEPLDAPSTPPMEPNFCPDCGKRNAPGLIHTCTPPMKKAPGDEG